MDEKSLRDNFARQGLMQTLQAQLLSIESGKAVISCPFQDAFSQQHGYFHAGVLCSIADSACGYAAMSLVPPTKDILSVEFKINLLKPANTPLITAVGEVIQAGKTLIVCQGTVFDASGEKILAKMMATMIAVGE